MAALDRQQACEMSTLAGSFTLKAMCGVEKKTWFGQRQGECVQRKLAVIVKCDTVQRTLHTAHPASFLHLDPPLRANLRKHKT